MPDTQSQRGLTLLNLLVAVLLIATLFYLFGTSYSSTMASQRRQVAAKELASALRSARVEAIMRNQVVLIHGIDNDWGLGWRMLVDISGKGASDPLNPVLLERQGSGKVRLIGNHFVRQGVRFNGLGHPAGLNNGTVHACDEHLSASHQRIVIAASGRIRVENQQQDTEVCS